MMTPDEINEISTKSIGTLTDWQCRVIVHYMIGYLRHAGNIDFARETFFQQIKAATENKALPVL